jgi:DNA-binding transcriptional MerR regulator
MNTIKAILETLQPWKLRARAKRVAAIAISSLEREEVSLRKIKNLLECQSADQAHIAALQNLVATQRAVLDSDKRRAYAMSMEPAKVWIN